MNVISPETRMMGLPYGEEIMIVGRTVWTQSTSVTDGQTDGQNYDHKDRATQSVDGKNPERVPKEFNTVDFNLPVLFTFSFCNVAKRSV